MTHAKYIAAAILVILFCGMVKATASTPKQLATQALKETKAQAVALEKARASTASALRRLDSAKSEIDVLSATLEETKAQVMQALVDLKTKNDQIAKLEVDKKYWQDKQKKALRELWVYRSIVILIVGGGLVFVLVKLGIIGAKIAS
jgi:septal ring factor EnvC (AmiA/AmiB activator)